ncbi:MAG TPA: hypothetical protein VH595_17010 [Verrucomicrobiae bacterium]|jgi:hypothetical protein|nr:hypothetical protein [Verrucomicrobiae bacterium]
MKNKTLLSVVTAAGLMGAVLPCVAGNNSSANNTFREPYVADVGTSVTAVPESLAWRQLPANVQSTIRDQAGNDPISQIKMDTKNGATVYCVTFETRKAAYPRPELVVAPDGSIVKEKNMGNAALNGPEMDYPSNR